MDGNVPETDRGLWNDWALKSSLTFVSNRTGQYPRSVFSFSFPSMAHTYDRRICCHIWTRGWYVSASFVGWVPQPTVVDLHTRFPLRCLCAPALGAG